MAVGSASDLTRGFGNQPRPRSTASSVAWSSSGMHYYRFAPEVRSRRGDPRRIVWAERDSPRRGFVPETPTRCLDLQSPEEECVPSIGGLL